MFTISVYALNYKTFIKLGKMKKFAKLIETDEGEQVLFVKKYSADNKDFNVDILIDHCDLRIKITLSYDTHEEMDKAFEKIDKEKANGFRNHLISLL